MYRYLMWWSTFNPSLGHEHHKWFLELFGDRDVTLFSVFPTSKQVRIDDYKDTLRVSYSGEHYSLDPSNGFDVNLVMERTDLARKIVCCPLFIIGAHVFNYWARFLARPPRPAHQTRFCAFVVSNGSAEVRKRFFHRLNAASNGRVESYGQVLNNTGTLAPREPEEYFRFLSQFKFVICFENTARPEYLTEKLCNAYLGGAVPIYYGATRAREWLNPHAFLDLETEATDEQMDRLVARVIELDADDDAYNAMYAQPLAHAIPEDLRMETIRALVGKVLAGGA